MDKTYWYKDAVFYQIWPRSFKDGDGDGMGDLYGVLEKLDYIRDLGCTAIWFSPLYPSPGVDCGYDVSDYMDISGEFGGMEAFRKVLEGAHERGMKVIMDLVVNHTSTEHEWFLKSRQRIDPYTDYYIWRDPKAGGRLPNNWDSMFGGKAWQWDDVRGQYYLHLFAPEQADLNMDNPLVREEIKKIMTFWLDMGVDGFREDVITFISKREGLPDDKLLPASKGIFHYSHGPRLHEYLSEFRRDVLGKYDCLVLAEAPLVTPKKALEYITESDDNELDMMIQFETMCADCLFVDYVRMPFSLRKLKRRFSSWQKSLEGKGWNMLYLENHDHSRVVSRYGSEEFRDESAKLLACCYLFQKGTPFIFQGQELGMINYPARTLEDYQDVQTLNTRTSLSVQRRLRIYSKASRDHARTPVQWSGKKHAGFSEAEPWFHVNPGYTEINAEDQQKDPQSVLNFYRKAVELRKSIPVVKNGSYREYMPLSGRFYVYERYDTDASLVVICRFSSSPGRFRSPKGIDLSEYELILSNYDDAPLTKRGFDARSWECRVYLKNNK